MLDQKADEAFVRAERGAVDAQGGLVGVIAVAVAFAADTVAVRRHLHTCTAIFGP